MFHPAVADTTIRLAAHDCITVSAPLGCKSVRRPVNLVREDDFHGVGFDEREAARGYQVSTREPWNKKQPIMISKDAAPIISFPMKNPIIGTVNTA